MTHDHDDTSPASMEELGRQVRELREEASAARHEAGRSRRRLRWVAGGLLAAMLVVNVAPVAANHLNVKTSDINNGAVTTPKLRDNSVKSAKINNGAVKTHDLANAAVGTAKLKNGSVGNKKLKNNSVGQAKLNHTAIAAQGYARVLPGGTVTEGHRITTDNIMHPSAGLYCFHDLPFQPTFPIVTPYSTAGNISYTANYGVSQDNGCPSGTSFSVVTRRADTGARTDRAFAIALM